VRFLDSIRRDVVAGLRLLGRAPGFSATAIGTLAIAIGANTAVFAVVNALLFKPTPVRAPQELGRIDTGPSLTSWLNYEELRTRNDSFVDVLASRQTSTTLATSSMPELISGQTTSPNFFTVLGVPAVLGRVYTAADRRGDVVVLSDHLWRIRFGSTPSIVGERLTLGGRALEVIGVMPRSFRGLAPPGLHPDFWVPLDTGTPSRTLADRLLFEFDVVGRLKPAVTHEQATAAIRVLTARMRLEHQELPVSLAQTLVVPVDGVEAFRGMSGLILPVLAFLGVMAIVSGFVLLIGCANIAGLLVSRATARQREIGIRLALGAGRRRLVRQLLTESLVLAGAGGAAGLLLTVWLVGTANAAVALLPVPVEFDLRIDGRVLGYAAALSTLACVCFGLAPAWSATRPDLISTLKEEPGSRAGQRTRQALVAGQVATCTALLVWSGLFLNSLRHASAVDPGFDPQRVVVAFAELERGSMGDAEGERIFVEWAQRVGASPAVEASGLALVVPLSLTGREDFPISLPSDDTRRWVVGNRLTPGWFDAVGIPLLTGRDFTWDDREGAPGVAIVNDTLARQLWNGHALGQRFHYGDRTLEVVGVVRDSKYATIGETISPTVYLPFRQSYAPGMTLHARTSDVNQTARLMADEMRRLAPSAPVSIKAMTDAVAVAVVPAQVGAAATGVFGLVAVTLSAIGVYGLVSFAVGQRKREFAIRQAVGASPSDIIRLILSSHTRLIALGLALGLSVGIFGATALRAFLTGVGPFDPLTHVFAALTVVGATILASLGPAWRAVRLRPLLALRDQ
jgi:predicted permease